MRMVSLWAPVYGRSHGGFLEGADKRLVDGCVPTLAGTHGPSAVELGDAGGAKGGDVR